MENIKNQWMNDYYIFYVLSWNRDKNNKAILDLSNNIWTISDEYGIYIIIHRGLTKNMA